MGGMKTRKEMTTDRDKKTKKKEFFVNEIEAEVERDADGEEDNVEGDAEGNIEEEDDGKGDEDAKR